MAHLQKWCDAMSNNNLTGSAMNAKGYDGLLAYMGTPNLTKDLRPAAISSLRAAGKFIIAVYETGTTDATNSNVALEYSQGHDHGNAIMADVLAKGLGDATAVCVAVDEHLSAAQIPEAVSYQRGFFDACRQANWPGRVGAYGFSEYINAVNSAHVADWFWCCGSASALPPWAHFWQDNTQTDTVGGVAVDIDWLINWLPAPALPAPPPAPPKPVGDEMAFTAGSWEPGQTVNKAIPVAVGASSQLYAKGWFSLTQGWEDATINGVWLINENAANIYTQTVTTFTLARDKRWWIELPDGTTQVSVQYTSNQSLGWSLELQPK